MVRCSLHQNVQLAVDYERPPKNTPLMVFCKAELKAMVPREQSTMLTFFLQQDADVNMADPRGADVTEVDHRGSTCVMLAAGCGNGHTPFFYICST